MTTWTKEWLSILVMLIVAGFFYVQLPGTPEAGASIFPVLLMGLMAGFAGIKIVSLLAFPIGRGEKAHDKPPPFWLPRLLFVMASIVAYALAVDYIGFFVSSFVFFMGTSLAVQQEPITLRSIITRLLVAGVFLFVIYVVFIVILKAFLPKSILF
jgi:hypothetical protein